MALIFSVFLRSDAALGGIAAVFGRRLPRVCLEDLGKIPCRRVTQTLGNLGKALIGASDQPFSLSDLQIGKIFVHAHSRRCAKLFHQRRWADSKALAKRANRQHFSQIFRQAAADLPDQLAVID